MLASWCLISSSLLKPSITFKGWNFRTTTWIFTLMTNVHSPVSRHSFPVANSFFIFLFLLTSATYRSKIKQCPGVPRFDHVVAAKNNKVIKTTKVIMMTQTDAIGETSTAAETCRSFHEEYTTSSTNWTPLVRHKSVWFYYSSLWYCFKTSL